MRLPSRLLPLPQPSGQSIGRRREVSTIGAERQPQLLRDDLLFLGRIEIRQIEDAIKPRVARVGEKPFGGFR